MPTQNTKLVMSTAHMTGRMNPDVPQPKKMMLRTAISATDRIARSRRKTAHQILPGGLTILSTSAFSCLCETCGTSGLMVWTVTRSRFRFPLDPLEVGHVGLGVELVQHPVAALISARDL